MTLTKKMTAAVSGLLLLSFLGIYLIIFNNERHFFIEQMNSNAKNTATSLGLSLANALVHHDQALLVPMVEMVFAHGYFSMIEVRNLQGDVVVSHSDLKATSKAPVWFIDLIQWPSLVQSAAVIYNGKKIGEVLVASDTRVAYDALWNNTRHLILCFFVIALTTLLVVFQSIKCLLNALQRFTNHAEAICDGDFSVETKIPATEELKSLTLAMNRVANEVNYLFHQQTQQIQTLE